jgi:hypothetical protein
VVLLAGEVRRLRDDPLRALLADEDRAVEMLVCVAQRWMPEKYQRWRHTSSGQQAELRARDQLAALREVAGL